MQEMQEKQVQIQTEYIRLEALLKFAGMTRTGGEAKQIIQSGAVKVNGTPCTQRGRKMRPGDTAEMTSVRITVR